VRKAVFVFLLVLLPFQFVWGAAAAYCQHEQSAAASHFGHHTHRHQASGTAEASAVAPGDQGGQSDPIADDPDCGVCHLSCARPISATQAVPAAAPVQPVGALAPPASAASPPSRIERPQWRLAV
jgi:hypothetical protein